MFCTQCGKPVADGSKFCAYCGAPVQGVPQPTASANAHNQPAPVTIDGEDDSDNVKQSVFKYVGAGMLATAVICVIANVGGYLSGMTLIKALFSSMNKTDFFEASFIIACILLLISHLGVIIFGVIGWNIVAELLAAVFATVALILINKINNDPGLPVSIYFSNNPDQKDPFA